jgi:hypothetical protein
MSSANRVVGKRRDDVAARLWIRINSGANSIRREVACGTHACPDNRISRCLN